ncbi:hypothetical protein C0J52_18506 [Blattella germanica]|nr:hypothetical protein C0J52_18506 [Blattella germanica]
MFITRFCTFKRLTLRICVVQNGPRVYNVLLSAAVHLHPPPLFSRSEAASLNRDKARTFSCRASDDTAARVSLVWRQRRQQTLQIRYELQLWVLELSTAPPTKLGVPSVKLIGNIHGNEAAGREILLHLIQLLKEQTILCRRKNAKHIDLNRSFPDYFQKNHVPPQAETKAVQGWLYNNTFVLSASLHGGALVANYPYENIKETSAVNFKDAFPTSISPDDDVFQHLAMTYSSKHPTMHRGEPCDDQFPGFKNGITNGAAWYPLTGEVHQGVKGVVVDDKTGEPLSNVRLNVVGRDMAFRTSPRGEFWRILLPGTYELQVFVPKYTPRRIPFTVSKMSVPSKSTWLQVNMTEFMPQTAMAANEPILLESETESEETTVGQTDEYSPGETAPELTSMCALKIFDSHVANNDDEQLQDREVANAGETCRGTQDMLLQINRVAAKAKIHAVYFPEELMRPIYLQDIPLLYGRDASKLQIHMDKASSHTAKLWQRFYRQMGDETGIKVDQSPTSNAAAISFALFGPLFLVIVSCSISRITGESMSFRL